MMPLCFVLRGTSIRIWKFLCSQTICAGRRSCNVRPVCRCHVPAERSESRQCRGKEDEEREGEDDGREEERGGGGGGGYGDGEFRAFSRVNNLDYDGPTILSESCGSRSVPVFRSPVSVRSQVKFGLQCFRSPVYGAVLRAFVRELSSASFEGEPIRKLSIEKSIKNLHSFWPDGYGTAKWHCNPPVGVNLGASGRARKRVPSFSKRLA